MSTRRTSGIEAILNPEAFTRKCSRRSVGRRGRLRNRHSSSNSSRSSRTVAPAVVLAKAGLGLRVYYGCSLIDVSTLGTGR